MNRAYERCGRAGRTPAGRPGPLRRVTAAPVRRGRRPRTGPWPEPSRAGPDPARSASDPGKGLLGHGLPCLGEAAITGSRTRCHMRFGPRKFAVVAAIALVAGTAGVPTAAADRDHGLPLGPRGLPETRTVETLQPGVTLTTIVRGESDPADGWTVEVAVPGAATTPTSTRCPPPSPTGRMPTLSPAPCPARDSPLASRRSRPLPWPTSPAAASASGCGSGSTPTRQPPTRSSRGCGPRVSPPPPSSPGGTAPRPTAVRGAFRYSPSTPRSSAATSSATSGRTSSGARPPARSPGPGTRLRESTPGSSCSTPPPARPATRQVWVSTTEGC